MRRSNRKKRITVIILCVVIVVALVLSYVMMFPLNVSAHSEPPPPPEFGTSGDYDESTLIFPEEEEEEKPVPVLLITTGPLRLDVGQQVQIQYVMNDFPEGTLLEWSTSNSKIAVIGADGKLLAVAPGDVEVIARAGEKRASLFITVNALRADRIIIVVDEDIINTGPSLYQVAVGDVTRFSADIEPKGAKVSKISWVLGNSNVATLSQNGEFIANAVGKTQVTVTADSLVASITIDIVESGIPIDTIWDFIKYGIILVVAIVAVVVVLTWMSKKRKKEKARQKAVEAKRRKEKEERRVREEAAAKDMRREAQDSRPSQTEERATMKVSGAAVGAGMSAPEDKKTKLERPLTLDDLE